MRQLKGCLLLALFYSVNVLATPLDVWLECANGVHATIKDYVLSAEGIAVLTFEHVENETDEQIVLVFADAHIEAKVLIQYMGPKVFLNDTDGQWAPCKATKIP